MSDLFEFSFTHVSAFESQPGLYVTNLFLDGRYQPSYEQCINKIKKSQEDVADAIRDARGDKTYIKMFTDKKFTMGKLISIRPTEMLNLDKEYSRKIVNYIDTYGSESLIKKLNLKKTEEDLYDFIIVSDSNTDIIIKVEPFSYKLSAFITCETKEEFNKLLNEKFTVYFIKYTSRDKTKYNIILKLSEKELYSQ